MRKQFNLKYAIVLLACFMLALGMIGCAQEPSPKSSSADKNADVAGKPATSETKEIDLAVYKNNDFLITPQELKGMLGSEDLALFDCNKPDIYAKEHIPGAVGIGLHALSDKVGKPGDPGWGIIKNKADMIKSLEALGIDNDKTVVFYSDVFKGPGGDGRAAWQLTLAGMDNVKFLVGGLSHWKELGYDVTDEPAQPKPTTGVELKDYDKSYIATKAYVLDNLDKQVVLDVRTEGEFKGSQKAGEPRGGHIKGAKLMLWLDLHNENGTPKTPEEITKIMASYGVSPEDDFILY